MIRTLRAACLFLALLPFAASLRSECYIVSGGGENGDISIPMGFISVQWAGGDVTLVPNAQGVAKAVKFQTFPGNNIHARFIPILKFSDALSTTFENVACGVEGLTYQCPHGPVLLVDGCTHATIATLLQGTGNAKTNVGPYPYAEVGEFIPLPPQPQCDIITLKGRVNFGSENEADDSEEPCEKRTPAEHSKGDPVCGASVQILGGDGLPVRGLDGQPLDVKTNGSGTFSVQIRTGGAGGKFGFIASKATFDQGPKSKKWADKISCTPGDLASVDLELYMPPPSCSMVGPNPVDALTGEKVVSITDLSVPGKGGLDFAFTRIYRTNPPMQDGPFGFGWSHNWDIRLREDGNGRWLLHWMDNEDHLMVRDPSHPGGFKGLPGFFYSMHYENNCWELHDTDGTLYHFIVSGVEYVLNFVQDKFGNQIHLNYDAQKRLASIRDTAGRQFTLGYEGSSRRVTSFTAPNAGQGGTWNYGYTPAGDLSTVTGPGAGSGYTAGYQYNGFHQMTAKDDPKGGKGEKHMSYEYDGAGRVVKEKRMGVTALELNYDLNENKIQITEENLVSEFLLDDYGRPRGREVNGQSKKLSYNSQGVTETVDIRGFSTVTTYKPGNRGEVDTITDPAGLRTSFNYDPYGFGIAVERREKDLNTLVERVFLTTLDSSGKILQTNDNGRITTFEYSPASAGHWSRKVDADGGVIERTFDPSTGLLLSEKNVRDNLAMQYSYDAWGRLQSSLNLTSNLQTVNTYDGAGNITRVDYIDPHLSTFVTNAYDNDGRLTSRTDEKGNAFTYIYSNDGRDNLVQEADLAGTRVKTTTYNSINLPQKETLTGSDGLGGTYTQETTFDYIQVACCSNQGRLQATHVHKAKPSLAGAEVTLSTTYQYDEDGNRTEIVDPKGNRTRFQYDGNNRVTSVTSGYGTPEARTVTYSYNAFGERKSITDGKGQPTQFTFNAHGELALETDAELRSLAYGYSDTGRLTSRTDRNNKPWSASYDDSGRMTSETFRDADNAAKSHRFIYGGVGEATDQLVEVIDPTGSKRFNYSHRGRIAAAEHPSLGRTLNFSHDAAGNVITISLQVTEGAANEVTHAYQYDHLNRVNQYEDQRGNIFNYFHDAAGQMRKVEIRAKQSDDSLKLIATGRTTYDGAGRVLKIEYRKGGSISGVLLAKVDYAYDSAGNRTSRVSASSQASFSHNSLNELTNDANSGDIRGTQSFVYDSAGNRASVQSGSNQINYDVTNDLNRLESYGGISFQNDPEGNRITKSVPPGEQSEGQTHYFYDGKQRLTKVTLPDGTEIRYGYDYNNHRVSRTVTKAGQDTETRTYLYHGNQVLEETLNGQRLVLYGWGPDGLASRTGDDGQTLFYLKDGLGSVMAIVDEKANIVQSYEYSAFGECLSGKDAVNAFRFVGGFGGQTDDDTGLIYFWNRWYDSQGGRWISEDPIRYLSHNGGQDTNVNLCGSRGRFKNSRAEIAKVMANSYGRTNVNVEDLNRIGNELNLYRYSEGRPTTMTDPSGLYVGIGAAVGLAACYFCAEPIATSLRGIADNHMRHCTASCEVSKKCTFPCSTVLGWLNEIIGLIWGGFDVEDERSNRIGRNCSYSSLCSDCGECCARRR